MSDHVSDTADPYWRGALSAEERRTIDDHLDVCAECRAAFGAVRVAMDALSAVKPVPQAVERLERGVIADLRRPRRPVFARIPAAAGIVAVLVLSGFFAGRVTAPRPASIATPDTSLHQFLMLLEEPAWPPAAPLTRAGYREWARDLERAGRYVEAEKLTEDAGFLVTPTG